MSVAVVRRPAWLAALLVAAVLLLDRADKAWRLADPELAAGGRHTVTPFFDIVLVWNRGISYGLLPQSSEAGRWALVVFAVAVCAGLAVWAWRTASAATGLALGLIVGGALSNTVDRLAYGAVADFYSLHAFGFRWYVFNLADTAIVVGVLMLLYMQAVGGHKTAENRR